MRHIPASDIHKDRAFVRRLFNDTAPHYDTVNRIFSLGSGNWYRRRCLLRAGLKPGQSVLDVAMGTGLIAQSARGIVGAQGRVVGIDLSEAMLAAARLKTPIGLVQGAAEALPFADHSVDFLVLGYAIRHIGDLPACFTEFRRVLRPGGTFLLLEVSSPAGGIFNSTLGRYIGRIVPWLSQSVTRQAGLRSLMDYHWQTMQACVPPPTILAAMGEAGFEALVCEAWFDMFRSYWGKTPA